MRVLIADDDTQVRSALRLMVEQRQDSVLAAEADSADEVIAAAMAISPDAILLDWQLCGSDSRGLLRRLRDECPDAAVIALSARPESKRCALEAGACAFISKNDPPEVLRAALEAVSGNLAPAAA
jgi:two-component system response regulator DesR